MSESQGKPRAQGHTYGDSDMGSWADEGLPLERRRQLLADEVRRLKRLGEDGGRASGSGDEGVRAATEAKQAPGA